MIYSMTGFGKASLERDGREITIELKSVNHRFLDIGMRLPRSISFLEDCLRKAIGANISRGHVDVFMVYKNNRDDSKDVEINYNILDKYYLALNTINDKYDLKDDISATSLMRMPEAFEIVEKAEDQGEIIKLCEETCILAVKQLKEMRKNEGQRLVDDNKEKLAKLSKNVSFIEKRADSIPIEYKEKLTERINDLLGAKFEIDEAKLANEVAFMADKASIDEEIVRLKSHIEQMKAQFELDEPVGRKLDFIVQEMNREINTIGSKSADVEILNCIIQSKSEIEKMREQIQNIE